MLHANFNMSKLSKNFKKQKPENSLGSKISDKVTNIIGSWKFIIIQSSFIFLWLSLNIFLPEQFRWDPYTFTLLNLGLSFQAAYTAPIIMMSQNRAAERDRQKVDEDYQVNVLAENEIETILKSLADLSSEIIKHKDIKEDLKTLQTEIQDLKKLMKKD